MNRAPARSIDTINYLNILFMLCSLIAAQVMPFEVFLLSYAVLGPAHYLTEISWLHDRNYFCPKVHDVLFFLICGIALFVIPAVFQETGNDISDVVIIGTFLSAAVFISPTSGFTRVALVFLCFAVALMLRLVGPVSTILALYLPTVIHVLLFTGVFVLYGALKERSLSGYLSFIFLIICAGLSLVDLNLRETMGASEYVMKGIASFQDDYHALSQVFGFVPEWSGVVAYMRFLAFAYTYHYLNWFSKTKIIEWHKISPIRKRVISSIYLTAILIYAIDFTLGLIALLFLSLLHVILEFPLNFRALLGIWRELTSRISRFRWAS